MVSVYTITQISFYLGGVLKKYNFLLELSIEQCKVIVSENKSKIERCRNCKNVIGYKKSMIHVIKKKREKKMIALEYRDWGIMKRGIIPKERGKRGLKNEI